MRNIVTSNIVFFNNLLPKLLRAFVGKIEVLDDNVAVLVDRRGYSSTLGLKQEIEDGQAVMF